MTEFVFYDTETTGIKTDFDQILQFAAIRTDSELRELERFEIRCRLLPNVVPSPDAIRITGVGPDRLIDPALPSYYAMVCTIRSKLESWSPAVFIGHNSLFFDEHLLRQAFYKNLHPPYLTNTNGNGRADSLRMIQCANALHPSVLKIPMGSSGRPSLSLERLAPENGFDHTAAHDAMNDVEAVVYLCRLLAERSKNYWIGFIRSAKKTAVLNFVNEEEIFTFVETYSNGACPFWMVCRIGENPSYAAEQFVYNLAIDPDELDGLDGQALGWRLDNQPKPVRALRSNACPALFTYGDTPEHFRREAPDESELRRRALRLRSNSALISRLNMAFARGRRKRIPSVYVEEQIYDSFASDADRAVMDRFHILDWSERHGLLQSIEDRRTRTLGERLIHCEAPHTLSAQLRKSLDIDTARRLMGTEGQVPWLTLPQALEQTQVMLADASRKDAALLHDLYDYLLDRFKESAAVAA